MEYEFQQTWPDVRICYGGFDINEENIEKCNVPYGNCKFILGDLKNITTVLETMKNNDMIRVGYPTLLVLSGSFTRRVLENVYDAVKILQKMASGAVNYIILGGLNESMINPFIAKRIGFEILSHPVMAEDLYVCRKLPTSDILQNKRNKMLRRNFLDLSLCPNPTALLPLLKVDFPDDLTIDLSFCVLSPELIRVLHGLLNEFPTKNIKLIFWDSDISAVNTFKDQFIMHAPIHFYHVTLDGYLMAPRLFFTTLFVDEPLTPSPATGVRELVQMDRTTLFAYKKMSLSERLNKISRHAASDQPPSVALVNT